MLEELNEVEELEARIKKAVIKFLKARDYEILFDDYDDVIVCKDGEETVLAFYKFNNDSFDNILGQEQFEETLIKIVKEHIDVIRDCPIRGDEVCVVILNDNTAVIRHHINAFSNVDKEN